MKAAALVLAFFLGQPAWAEENCPSFRACYELGNQNRDKEKFSVALRYYAKACAMKTKASLVALKYSACLQVVRFSGDIDGYAAAERLFRPMCESGIDNGCFFLGTLEEEKGNLEAAIEIMKPLCESSFSHPRVHGYDGCHALKTLRAKWDRAHPPPRKPARTGPVQMIALGTILVLPVVSLILVITSLITRHKRLYRWALAFGLLSFGAYGFYESGVSRYANIRIDLLLILPALLVALASIALSSVMLLRSGKRAPAKGD